MNWNTGAMAGGSALLAWALGGIRGLLVMIALVISYWVARSVNIAAAAHDEEHSEERTPWRETERKAEQARESQQRERRARQERETERLHQHQNERAANQSGANEWWSVLGVPPHASADEIRHAYRRKIKQCHPDRVIALAPELLELAERATRTLNAAYSEANRARRSASAVH